jgi:hypothetical protein
MQHHHKRRAEALLEMAHDVLSSKVTSIPNGRALVTLTDSDKEFMSMLGTMANAHATLATIPD